MAPSQIATRVISICATVWAVEIHAPSSKPACTAPRMSASPSVDRRVLRVEEKRTSSTAARPSQGMEVGGGGDVAAGAAAGGSAAPPTGAARGEAPAPGVAPAVGAAPSTPTAVTGADAGAARGAAAPPAPGPAFAVGSLIDAHPSACQLSRPPTYPAEGDPRDHPHRRLQSSPPRAARLW